MTEGFKNLFQIVAERVKQSDKVIWMLSVMLMIISIILIYSTTNILGNPERHMLSQFAFFGAAFFCMVGLLFVHYNKVRFVAARAMYLIIPLMLAMQVWGVTINGAKRWIRVPIIGFTFQMSELLKILLILYVAQVLAAYQTKKGCDNKAFWKVVIGAGLVCLFVVMSDFSSAVLIGLTVFVMLLVGRINLRYIVSAVGLAALLGGTVFLIATKTNWRPDVGRVATVLNRIERFASPEKAEERDLAELANYKTPQELARARRAMQVREDEKAQVEAAKAAVATSWWIGKGPGNSNVQYVLPLPYSDFIFAIIVEELGAIFGFLLLFAYCAILYRAGLIAQRCTRTFPAFMVIGLSTMIVLQAFVNMGVAIDILPVTGQPLPFVSKGGTSILVTGISLGLILSVTYWLSRAEREELEKELNH